MKRLLPLLLLALSTASAAALADEATHDLWMAKCKNCHGEDGKAHTRVGEKEQIADFTSKEWQKKHTDNDIRTVIEEGSKDKPKMKPYKDRLTPEEIDALVFYIRDLQAK